MVLVSVRRLATALVPASLIRRLSDQGGIFSALIGLVAEATTELRQDKLGMHHKQCDRYLRSLFPVGALAVIRMPNPWHQARPWLTALFGAAASEGRRIRTRQ